MTSHIKYLLLFLIVSFLSWVYLTSAVQKNEPDFQPDEMYWIGTARIVPLLLKGNTTDKFWNEYYGYANFNGAKIIYGLGLWTMGHRDFSFTGYPPSTYYQFQSIVGKYPVADAHYPILKDAREISATFASLSVGLLAVWIFMVFDSLLAALLGALVLIIHPIFLSFATIAFADSFFLFFEMAFLVLLELYLDRKNNKNHILLTVILGACLAEIAAIKLNGILFAGIFVFDAVAVNKLFSESDGWKGFLSDTGIFLISGINMFFLLHPNFSFSGASSPLDIITGRLAITSYQMAYFSHTLPGHVLWTIPDRVLSSVQHLFLNSPLSLLTILSLILLFLRKSQSPFQKQLNRVLLSGIYVYDVILQYVVFNEQRYLLPILPFLILFSVYIFAFSTRQTSKVDSVK